MEGHTLQNILTELSSSISLTSSTLKWFINLACESRIYFDQVRCVDEVCVGELRKKMAAATPAPDSNVHFMLNMLSVPSQSCTRKVYNRNTLLRLRNSNFSKNLSGATLALEPQTLWARHSTPARPRGPQSSWLPSHNRPPLEVVQGAWQT